MQERKRRLVTAFQRRVLNPVTVRRYGHARGRAVLETTGHRSGLARRTPVGGALQGTSFWLVAEHGRAAAYVRNLEANPRVRLQHLGRWYTGTAHTVPEDDPRQRLRGLPWLNGVMVRAMGTDLLSVRIDLDQAE